MSRTLQFLDSLFALEHDTDNANELNDVNIGGFSFNVFFIDTLKGHSMQFMAHNHKVIDIVHTSGLTLENIKFKYLYRVSFYSSFFRLIQQQKLKPDSIFLDLFGCQFTTYQVSRLDVCFDISNRTVLELSKTAPSLQRENR